MKKIIVRSSLVFFSLFLGYLLISSLNQGNLSKQFLTKLEERIKAYDQPFPLSELVEFSWDEVCILTTDADDSAPPGKGIYKFIKERGFEYGAFSQRIPYFFVGNEYETAFLFIKDNRVISTMKNVGHSLAVNGHSYLIWSGIDYACSGQRKVYVELIKMKPQDKYKTIRFFVR